jgi:thiol-disulfide isomerase/thioredoxin
LGRTVVRVTVTEADAARGELSLPEIPVAIAPVPSVGDVAKLDFQLAGGSPGKSANYAGKFTVIHFWASSCGACKQQLPALRRLQDRFGEHGLQMLGLSVDDDSATWQDALKKLDLPWPQGRLAAGSDAGISSVPAYWLLDPAGKIVAKVYDPDELAKTIAERLK